ncbi:hypothetical protein ACA910_010754 [Epithemia clementina (nom. ined.)]
MEDLFNSLSSSARFDKKKKTRDKARDNEKIKHPTEPAIASSQSSLIEAASVASRDRTGKRDTSTEKQQQVHREQIAAFRRAMAIKIASKDDQILPDPISSFSELRRPSWWTAAESDGQYEIFRDTHRAVIRNVDMGKWKEPTPIQMQAIPTLLERRDFIGAAPTGSGKSGAFILPALLLSCAPDNIFYNFHRQGKTSGQGSIRVLLIAPSLELAAQLHREVERLGTGKPGGLSAMLLSKTNSAHVIAGSAGGKQGLDVLVSTPLRLVDTIEKGLKLNSVRLIVLDEADRLLDAADGHGTATTLPGEATERDAKGEVNGNNLGASASGSNQTKTFLAQMDTILSEIPDSAVRALFSATVTATVRSLSESILRNPVDATIGKVGNAGANPDIEQTLSFVSNEHGKLLAIRQLVANGQIRPPMIIFLQSQERAQALFEELLYDNIHVDVIHAGRSKSAREKAVAKFRKGETWVLICTDLVARGVDFRAVNMVINYDLPSSGITYIHRIGRTGRAGRKGTAITFFTEADFENLRAIANIMKQSGCHVDEWMLNLKKQRKRKGQSNDRKPSHGRDGIDTTPRFEKRKRSRIEQIIRQSKAKNQK